MTIPADTLDAGQGGGSDSSERQTLVPRDSTAIRKARILNRAPSLRRSDRLPRLPIVMIESDPRAHQVRALPPRTFTPRWLTLPTPQFRPLYPRLPKALRMQHPCAPAGVDGHADPRLPRAVQGARDGHGGGHRVGRILPGIDAVGHFERAARPAGHAGGYRAGFGRRQRPEPGPGAQDRRAHDPHRQSSPWRRGGFPLAPECWLDSPPWPWERGGSCCIPTCLPWRWRC